MTKPVVAHIVAVSRNGIIGNNGALPWHLSADLKRFRLLTTDHCVIMGRKTFDSIGKPLPKRHSVVISRAASTHDNQSFVSYVSDFDAALNCCATTEIPAKDKVFVIGGAEIYRLTLPHTNSIYLTRILTDVSGDTFYPESWLEGFKLESSEYGSENGIEFKFEHYIRI